MKKSKKSLRDCHLFARLIDITDRLIEGRVLLHFKKRRLVSFSLSFDSSEMIEGFDPTKSINKFVSSIRRFNVDAIRYY